MMIINFASLGLDADSKLFENTEQIYDFNETVENINYLNSHDIHQAIKLNYNPVDSLSGIGSTFSVMDELNVSHSTSLSLNESNGQSDSFNIQPPSNFTADILTYNLTIASTSDIYELPVTSQNKHYILDSGKIRLAQAFQVVWDYAVFYGAELNLVEDGPTLGNDEIELYVVKADGLNQPNLTDVRAYEINGPYNSSNTIPTSILTDYGDYDFLNTTLTGETILEMGTYFVVIELTVIDDAGDAYDWLGKQGGTSGYPFYYHDGASWTLVTDETRGLNVELLRSDSEGNAIEITDPSLIALTDNAVPITSLTQEIVGDGDHSLSSNTTVEISMNNSYTFSRIVTASSTYIVSNSSHLTESVYWTVNWTCGALNLLPYTNPSRFQELYTADDWNDITFNLEVNESMSIPGTRTLLGYVFDIDSLLLVDKYESGDFSFTTTSLNYLYDVTLNSNSFNLGYWTTNTSHAIGYNGSIVTANIYIKDSSLNDELTGNLNFTLYDPNGNIVPVKNDSLYPTLIFNDLTPYTILDSTQESAGQYTVSTVFDPSFNGTDIEGQWTATCFWSNDTEIGFFSLTISVGKSTTASFNWEENYGINDYTNTTTSINRINEESVTVRITYNNISDPFLVGDGTPITAAPVAFNTSWGTSGVLNYIGPYYEGNIAIDTVVGNYSITLTATGISLEEHSISFYVYVYHTFAISPTSGGSFQAYYNDDESIIQFYVEDTSNSSTAVLVDDMAFYINDVLLIETLQYGIREFAVTNLIQFELYSDIDGLNLLPDTYSIRISVAKQDFIVDYGQENATSTVNLEILTTPTTIDLVSSDDEVFHGNETTITFYYVDTINPENIEGATFEITLDLDSDKAEIIGTPSEDQGLYSVTLRIYEPQETTVNVFLTISKPGYEEQTDFLLKTISIIPPDVGIPIYIFVIIGIFSLAAIIAPTVIVLRRRIDSSKKAEKTLFARIYGLYESVLSITKLIIVHRATGLPVYEMDLGSEITLDPSLITGFLTAISSMGVELRGDRAGAVKRLQYKNFFVTGSESGNFTIYTFSETELNTEIEDRLTVISVWFAKMFSNITEDWDGSTEVFRINLQGITEKIMKEIHLWIFYPFTVSPYKALEIEEFNGLQKRLIDFITNNENVTISRIFDELDDIRIEKGLPIIFEFIEQGILTPIFDAYKIATVRF